MITADMEGNRHNLSPDGKQYKKKRLENGIAATPVLNQDDSRLYIADLRSGAYSIDPPSGEILWEKTLEGKWDPRIQSALLYLPKANWIVFSRWEWNYTALTVKDGEKALEWPAGASPQAAASADADGLIYSLRAETPNNEPNGVRLVKTDPSTGSTESLFFQSAKDRNDRSMIVKTAPVLDEERKRIYIITNFESYGILHALSLPSGESIWSHEFSRNVYAAPAITPDGSVVVGDMSGDVHCFALDGSRRWRYTTGAMYILASPVIDADGNTFLGDAEGFLHSISSKGAGEPFYEADRAIRCQPAFDPQGRLVIASGDGEIYMLCENI